MAPPEKTFPVSDLEDRVHIYSKDYKEKSRKLPADLDLKRDCALYELVQYSCTSKEELEERALSGESGAQSDCYPFVRLFRQCKFGNQKFHVETTAWEGRHKWKPSKRLLEEQARAKAEAEAVNTKEGMFAQYGSYFWSGK